MIKSNIFVYIELAKFIDNLTLDPHVSKQYLKLQAGYFNILPTKYFSDSLAPEWDSISLDIRKAGPTMNEEGKIIRNAVVNTIEQMSNEECINLTKRITALFEKVKCEFK